MNITIPIFVINLKKDVEKRKHMEYLCKQHNLECKFIDAVYGKDLDEEYISKIYNSDESIRFFRRELSRGELGCALSHLSIYKLMVENDIKQAIIFEDDICINEGFLSVIQSIDTFPDDWELVLLGYYQRKEKVYRKYQQQITPKYKLARLSDVSTGAFGYLLNLKCAKKLINELSTIKQPIDHYTGDEKYINLYGITPRVVDVDKSLVGGIESERLHLKKVKHSALYRIKRELFTQPFMKYIKPFLKPSKYN